MKGDFSTWRHDALANDQGVLHQQGRVTLDADLTAGELIDLYWRIRAGRDVIGSGVLAVPAAESDGFEVLSASVVDGEVVLELNPGHGWADGILVHLAADPTDPAATVSRVATWLEPPLGSGSVGTIGAGVRDTVVLELALEELSAFQEPARLLEPALGGPDTAERITVRTAFRLFRLGTGQSCSTIGPLLVDGPTGKGRLTASLEPVVVSDEDCPVVTGGGYTGFEHNLFRVEIAHTDGAVPLFKWSRVNGGLVGRGTLQAGPPPRIVISANRAAIVNASATEFYLEVLQRDEELGHWRVVCGTPAALTDAGDLELTDPPTFGALAFGGDPVFFRLWDGIEEIGGFTDASDPEPLADGVRLVFDPPAGATYRPGDYWTFALRAGELPNPEVLLDLEPPAGPVLVRVPLATLHWSDAQDTEDPGRVEDCRRRFRPLTNQKVCCTLLVGDGVRSFGDFDSLEEAALHLPTAGGELCLLPGIHFANLTLENRANVRIHGCPRRTLVLPRATAPLAPIFTFRDCAGIEVADLDLVSFFGAIVDARGTTPGALQDLRVRDCRMVARTRALAIDNAEGVEVARNLMWLLDTLQGRATVRLRALGALIERNRLGVWPFGTPPGGDDQPDPEQPTPEDPCADPADLYGTLTAQIAWVHALWMTAVAAPPPQPYRAWGGIHLLGGCEEVRLLENHVDGGAGHGVTLGGLLPGEEPTPGGVDPSAPGPQVALREERMQGFLYDASGNALGGVDLYLVQGAAVVAQARSGEEGAFRMSAPPGTYTLLPQPGLEIVRVAEAEFEGQPYYVVAVREVALEAPAEQAFLYRIAIQENEIERMALSGIGFRPFTEEPPDQPLPDTNDPTEWAELFASLLAPRELLGACNVVRDLSIRGNRIHHNLRAVFDDALRRSSRTVGQGGVSLGLVETGILEANDIHDNGTSAVNPVCGIFLGYGEDVEIRGNRIAANGPVPDGYETDRVEGLRGGVFVRFASALLVGGESDAQQKPAVRVADNRIDQPAGRPITVFAFGPVACVGNHLNSEHEGRWGVWDRLAGGVLILDLGGFHRHFVATGGGGTAPNTGFETNRLAATAPLLLPGGEVLFNSNQLRLGTGHRSLAASVVVTLDDLGMDGNQCTVLRRDLLLANALCMAQSLRVTDNRFREDAGDAFLSLLTYAVGLSTAGRLRALNTTTHNQADHCIVAASNAPRPPDPAPHGNPVLEQGNLVVHYLECGRRLGSAGQNGAYVTQALAATLFAGRTPQVELAAPLAQQAAFDSVGSIRLAGNQVQMAYAKEAARLGSRYGAEHPRVRELRRRVDRGALAGQQLAVGAQLVLVREASVPAEGALVDGRVTDAAAMGEKDLTVELVDGRNRPVGVSAKTDRSGYYALELSAEEAEKLQGREVFVRVLDPAGNVLHRDARPLVLAAAEPARADVVVPTKRVSGDRLKEGRVIFRRADRAEAPASPGAPAGPAPSAPATSTPLESVRGIGPKRAARLRAAGIEDLETLLRTPSTEVLEIAGFDADVVRREAQKAVEKKEREGKKAERKKRARERGEDEG